MDDEIKKVRLSGGGDVNVKPGIFLYADRKTVCKNTVVYCIKR
jgi:hypothetical protein